MTPTLLQLNKTLWSPGEQLHPMWWEKLSLCAWQKSYRQGTELGRQLDKLVIARSQLSLPIYDKIPAIEQLELWLSILPNLSLLAKATGLLLQYCPDYFWDKAYRDQLGQYFSKAQITQLIGLCPEGSETPKWSPEQCIEQAEIFVTHALYAELKDKPIWPLLGFRLPPVDLSSIAQAQQENRQGNNEAAQGKMSIQSPSAHTMMTWLFRIERFL